MRGRSSPDYPWARSDDEWRTWLRDVGARRGTEACFEESLRDYCPTVADDPEFLAWYVRHMRSSTSEVLVSRTVKDLVAGGGFTFVERGSHTLKGVPGEWQLYAVA